MIPADAADDNGCLGKPSNPSVIDKCDCHIRYLKHTNHVSNEVTPCQAPAQLRDKTWGSINETDLLCGKKIAGNKLIGS